MMVFNHKYAGIGRSFKMLVAYLQGIFYPCFRVTLKIFRKCSASVCFDFASCHLLRKKVRIHSWNVNDKYFIAITTVEQSLHPVDYAWWRKQQTCIFTLC